MDPEIRRKRLHLIERHVWLDGFGVGVGTGFIIACVSFYIFIVS